MVKICQSLDSQKLCGCFKIRKTTLFLIVAASGEVSDFVSSSCLSNLESCQLVQTMHMGFIFYTAENWSILLEQVMSEQHIVLLAGMWWQLHGVIAWCTSLKTLINNARLIFWRYLSRQLLLMDPYQSFRKSREELVLLLYCMYHSSWTLSLEMFNISDLCYQYVVIFCLTHRKACYYFL